jgi:hypothetical protein
LDRDDRVESRVANDDAAGMLAEVAGKGEDALVEVEEGREPRVVGGNAGFDEACDWGLGIGDWGRCVAL